MQIDVSNNLEFLFVDLSAAATHNFAAKTKTESSESMYYGSFKNRLCELQLFEHVVTSSQQRSHFFLHVNGRPQTTQIFDGKLDLLGFFSLSPLPLPRPLPNSRKCGVSVVNGNTKDEQQLRPTREDGVDAKNQTVTERFNRRSGGFISVAIVPRIQHKHKSKRRSAGGQRPAIATHACAGAFGFLRPKI
jgi:hypothetical protein